MWTPVDRKTYAAYGFGLMGFKYGLDAALIWWFAGHRWTPLDYLSPLWSTRQHALQGAPPWLAPVLVVITLRFLWIGVTLTLRRAVHAGLSAWTCLLFFLPGVNYVLMLALCLVSHVPQPARRPAVPPPQVDERLTSALLGVAASLGITLVSVGIGIYLKRSYSTGLFLGVPFTIGYISSYIYNRRFPRSVGESIVVALASVTIAGGALIVFALEGMMCTVMALPLAVAVAWPGAVVGRLVAQRSLDPGAGVGLALLTPLLVAVEPRPAPPAHEVVMVVEIAAPPEVVWRHVVTFPELPPPTEFLFRAGVAAPTRARIVGRGGGAVRYCDFTPGSFVGPVTAWEENRPLAFDITTQAPPMTEWSPYREVNPPHLDGYFAATHGEFRLTPLPGGRTRLEGRTEYVVDMFPQAYWTLPAGRIVAAIHGRVLRHIAALAEEEERQ